MLRNLLILLYEKMKTGRGYSIPGAQRGSSYQHSGLEAIASHLNDGQALSSTSLICNSSMICASWALLLKG